MKESMLWLQAAHTGKDIAQQTAELISAPPLSSGWYIRPSRTAVNFARLTDPRYTDINQYLGSDYYMEMQAWRLPVVTQQVSLHPEQIEVDGASVFFSFLSTTIKGKES